MRNYSLRRSESNECRSGFTLVELLIVITIMLLLLSMTVMSVNFLQDSDRVSGAARQVQSFLAGARDRALYNKRPIGVRFYLDSDAGTQYTGNGERRTVSAMAYIDLGEMWNDGAIQLRRLDRNFDGRTDQPSGSFGDVDVNGDGTIDVDVNGDSVADDPSQIWMVAGQKANKWWELKRRGLLVDGVRIRIPAGSQGTWYPVDTRYLDVTSAPTAVQFLVLQVPYADPGDGDKRNSVAFGGTGPDTYELELPPKLMPLAPSLLPDDVVIDLDGSRLPSSWRPSAQNGGNFSQYMDVVFSPKGNVIGAAAASGLVHLYVCDRKDATSLKDLYIDSLHVNRPNAIGIFNAQMAAGGSFVPADEIDPTATSWVAGLAGEEPYICAERRLVSLFTQTGAITVHQVNPGGLSSTNGLAVDPFLFAETGAEAK